MSVVISPASDHLKFLSPMSSERADQLVAFLAAHARGTVVDVGCGWASFLFRLLETNPALHGLGLDIDDSAIEYARLAATQRGLDARVELIAGDALNHLPKTSQGGICIGASQAWWPIRPTVSEPLDYTSALDGLRRLVEPGSPVVYGEGIWSAEPTDAAIAPLAGRRDEFVFLPDLIELANESGFVVIQAHEASLDEWDVFESGFTAGYGDWLARHDKDDPNYSDVLGRMNAQQAGYYRGYRGVLGMAYLCLLAV